jgi:hypothetical protein
MFRQYSVTQLVITNCGNNLSYHYLSTTPFSRRPCEYTWGHEKVMSLLSVIVARVYRRAASPLSWRPSRGRLPLVAMATGKPCNGNYIEDGEYMGITPVYRIVRDYTLGDVITCAQYTLSGRSRHAAMQSNYASNSYNNIKNEWWKYIFLTFYYFFFYSSRSLCMALPEKYIFGNKFCRIKDLGLNNYKCFFFMLDSWSSYIFSKFSWCKM